MAKIGLLCCLAAVFAAVPSVLAGEVTATDYHFKEVRGTGSFVPEHRVVTTNVANSFAKETRRTKPDPDFDIPSTLIGRMQAAHYATVRGELCKVDVLDVCELAALMKIGLTNAQEIAQRPRGDMKFCDDLFTEEYRRNMWPFDVEAFEKKSLETNLVRGADGCYRFADASNRGDASEAAAFRWVNREIEQWAVRQLDAVFPRMDEKLFCKISGDEKMPDGMSAWVVDKFGTGNVEWFAIQRNEDGAWHPRSYFYGIWDGREPTVVGMLDSFPTRKEGATLRAYRFDVAARHNLAVLMWRHCVNAMFMNPWVVQSLLKKAEACGVPTAEANLKVLLAHIPELKKDGNPADGVTNRQNSHAYEK